MSRISASPVTRFYQVRKPRPHIEWARIWITDDGSFTTISDYGNYGYWWHSLPECGMRQFLIGVSPDYLINKLVSGERERDAEATRKAIYREIIDRRQEGDFTREEARTEWDHVRQSNFSTEMGFWDWAKESTMQHDEPWTFLRDRYPQQAHAFVMELWPLFVEQLKAELLEERHEEFKGIVESAIDGSQAR